MGLLRVLLAQSGTIGLELSVAHLNHGTRGDASAADAAYVGALAETLHIPFDLGHWRPTRSSHFESDARRARYDWLTGIAKSRGATVVAAGHTADDQVETILHRIIRGTGIRGLSGIRERRNLASDPDIHLVRPLLSASRAQIRGYLEQLGQSFHEDATNADITRTRSRIRHDLIPKLEAEYNPRLREALDRLGRLAAATDEVVDAKIRKLSDTSIIEVAEDRIVINRPSLEGVSEFLAVELLRRVWNEAGWPEREMSTARWERLYRFMIQPTRRSRLSLGSGVEAILRRNFLVLNRERGVV